MSRQNGLSRAYASASVTAILGLLMGCSQPASYATVDLGGSYGNGTPQGYSSRSGLPVYQSTQVYTTPGVPQPVGQQLVYMDAPTNQVASLSPGYSGGYSQPFQQSYPVFDSVAQGPILTDETILRSDGYIDTGAYGGVQTATLSPGAGSIGFDQMPIVSDVPQYLPAPQPLAPLPYSAPIMTEALPLPAPVELPMIEAAPLAAPIAAPMQMVADDYANLSQQTYAPVATPIQSAPLDMMQSDAQTFAGVSTQPARNDVQQVVDYYDLRSQQQEVVSRDVSLPAMQAPAAVAPQAVYTPRSGEEIALPPASQAYPRPYEALPPGFFPTYEFPSGADLISQAPVAQPPVQVAALAPQAPINDIFTATTPIPEAAPRAAIQQASGVVPSGQVYVIQPGDTLYGIARAHGVTPLDIAQSNGLPLAGTIYPGDMLSIPAGGIGGRPETLGDAPVVVLQTAEAAPINGFSADAASIGTYTADLTDQSAEMIDIEELARMFRERESGQSGAAMPVISAAAGSALRGRPDLTPTELISEPIGVATAPSIIPNQELIAPTPVAYGRGSYAWPVHGEVYRTNAGGIEIVVPAGQPVSAAASGRVVHVANGSRGTLVVIEHDDGWRSLTIGLQNATVQTGQRVTTGAPLGYSGDQRIGFELRDGQSNVAETLGLLQS